MGSPLLSPSRSQADSPPTASTKVVHKQQVDTWSPVIRIRGARTHNLKNVDLDLPHQQLIVITGVSGSGKSSLAFDTLYAEGQRQYIDSLSVYARQFIDQIQRPDFDSIDGLQPTLCIEQRVGTANPRSTVATITEVYDYLRLLMARVASPYCYECGSPILQQSADQILAELNSLPLGTKVIVMAPMVRGRRGQHREVLDEIRRAGLLRARVNGETFDLESVPHLDLRRKNSIEAIVDKLIVREGASGRLADSVNLALKLADGLVSTSLQLVASGNEVESSPWTERLFSTRFACADCGISYEEIEPRTFSFNSPYGACPDCDGMGRKASDDDSEQVRVDNATVVCATCNGTRLRREALSVKLADRNIAEICSMNIGELQDWFTQLPVPVARQPVATPIVSGILNRLQFLNRVGVGYISLDRGADTLSGGELQRIRLATCIGSGLVGVCYVLDEPSIGLHQSDNDRLIESLRDLQRQGNTVIVVEHDEAMMRAADLLVDIGPGAGNRGGQIVAVGNVATVCENRNSLTAQYLRGEKSVWTNRQRRTSQDRPWIKLEGAKLHNLQNVSVRIPLGCLVGISGVSGSGKSSLVVETLAPAIASSLGLSSARPGPFRKISGIDHIDKLIQITQDPIGRSPRSTPATYCGLFDLVREVFANTRESKQRGFTASRFSFNAASGRCPQCQGQGFEKIEMNFLPDLFAICSACKGKRFNRQTLQVRYREKSIADVLDMCVDEAAEFFANFSKIHRFLDSLNRVGLGYLALGQSSTTLSGGEAQRIKLATELARSETGRTLYFLDEPTTGLHFDDIRRLLDVLDRLVEAGNTVIVIEHNLDVLSACDWLVDLGPLGGAQGGQIVAEGPPEEIARCSQSVTGHYLAHLHALPKPSHDATS